MTAARALSTRLLAMSIAAMLVAGLFDRSAAQMVVPPGASLDIQVPAAPTPVRIGGRIHLAYELHITNFRTVDVALARIDVLGDADASVPLATYQDAALRAALARAGARRGAPDPDVVGSGMRTVLFVWLPLDEATPVPSRLHHRISFEVLAAGGREAGAVDGGGIGVRREPPLVLAAPLRGGPWVAVYDPSSLGGHRRAVFAVGGRARIPARFAIDWVKAGDASSGYGADVLAVANATVVSVVDDVPEPTVSITLDNAAGNYITLELGGGRFAFYEHLRPGSIRVKVGQQVRAGDVLAALGASGSVSSGAHLHFHVSDANSSLGAEGVPYVFARFEELGAFESLDAFAKGNPWLPSPSERRLEMPRGQSVVRF